jgi:prepilin-type N-terminal cleavage/methylation domain-containing protein
MTRKPLAAFTLIELLIVISIIAVLASIALPAYNGVKERGDQTKDLSNAKQVALALRQFAIDNNGSYPAKKPAIDYSDPAATSLGAGDKSNDAFWWLFPTYLQSEQIFAISGSAYTPNNPDNKIDPAGSAARTDTLKPGENSFAYVSGLTDTTNPTFPLIADGFVNGSAGSYTSNKARTGGVWSGKKAVVVFCDASGQIIKVDAKSNKLLRPSGSSTPDLFTGTADGTWIDAALNPVLNPDPPAGAQ